jgi:hypothetical protein
MKTFLPVFALLITFIQTVPAQNTLNNAGLTAATPASVAYSLRNLSSGYTGFAIKVKRSSDNAQATVAFDGSGTVSAASVVTFTPGATVSSTLGTVQTGTISSTAARTGTVTVQVNKTGTITVSNNYVTVTGTGTSFTTQLVVGDLLFNAANNIFIGVVASITSNTSLSLANYATAVLSGVSFKNAFATVTGTGTNFAGQLATGDRLFNAANTYLGTVAAITSATSLTLNSVDATAATGISFQGDSSTITGSGTNFTTLMPGTLLISNNITLGIVSSVVSATSLTLTTKAGAAVNGSAFKSTAGSMPFSTYYSGTSVYVNTWYDQSGNGRDAIQSNPGNLPLIVNAGTLYTLNGRPSMQYSGSMYSFLQTSTLASYLNNTLYTLNDVTAETSSNPYLSLPLTTTGGNGPNNTLCQFGYRSPSAFTIAQYGNDQNFNATPSTLLELHTGVKISTAASQFYKNGSLLGVVTSTTPSALLNMGLLSVGYYTATSSYYNGSISELTIFPSALGSTDVTNLDNNQLAYYAIASVYWTGAVSTDWNTAGNWSTGVVPTLSSPALVTIPAGQPLYPLISATSQANSISLEAGTSLTITGTLQLSGTLNNLGTCTASAGTIQYMGTVPQVMAASTFAGNAVQNVVVNNSTGVSLGGNLAITGNLTFTSGTLAIVYYALTLGGTVTNSISGGLTGGTNSSLIINGAGSPTLSFTQTTPGSTNALNNLTINSPGQTVTLANNLVMAGTGAMTFTAGKLAIGNSTLTLMGNVVNTVSGGLSGGAPANLVINGTVSPTLSFDQTTPGTTNSLNTLTINCSGQTATLANSLNIPSALTITSGTLADEGNQLISTGTLNLNGGSFQLGSSTVATTWPAFTTNTILAGATVVYAAGVAQTVSALPVYQNLTISATGGAIAANNLTVNGILNLAAANPSSTMGCLSTGSYTLNMGPSSTTIGQGDVTGIVSRSTILPNVTYTMGNPYTSITFPNVGTLPTQMSIMIVIGAAPTWMPGAINRWYDFIQTGGSGTQAVISAHYQDAELNGNSEVSMVDFSYRVAGAILNEQGKSSYNTTQNWVGLSNVNVAFFSSTFGNVQLTLGQTAITTLTWNGSTTTSWITATNWTPNGGPAPGINLIIPSAATTLNSPTLPATANDGSITIQSGGILNTLPGAQLTLNSSGLAWSNAGTFNAGTSTVIFTSPGATLDGTTNFYNLTINSGAALQMTSNTFTGIGGTLTNNGTFQAGLLQNTVAYTGASQTVVIPNGPTGSYSNLVINGSGTTVLPAVTLNVLGNLTVSSAVSATGNTISMNGISGQSINGAVPVTLNNLVINNTAGPVSLNQNLTVGGTLTFTAGQLAIGGNTVTLSGNVINTIPNGITGNPAGSLTVSGTVSPTLSFDQTVPGTSNALNGLTINSNGQSVLLGSNLAVNSSLTFAAGKLAINGHTLTVNGAVANTVAGGLTGSSSSNLVIGGGGASPSLSFDQTTPGSTNLLNNFSVNSSGQSVSLASPLVIGATLNLTNGLVISTSGNSLTLEAAAIFTGGSDTSFVSGPLIRNTAATGAYVFPVGKVSIYNPVSVTPASSAAGLYRAEYFPVAAPTGALNGGLTGIATDQYWDVAQLSGSGAQVTLTYAGSDTWSTGSPASTDNITVVHFNGASWDPVTGTTIAGNVLGLAPVTSQTMTTFSPFTFGYGPGTILALTLIDFKALVMATSVELSWTASNEVSFEGYDVERSADGSYFYTIGSVPATDTLSVETYTWPDNAPLAGVSYYRLRMINKDGSFTYSLVLEIDRNAPKGISVFPNPVTNHTIILSLAGEPAGTYLITLYATNGGRVASYSIPYDGGGAVTTLVLNQHLPAGLYYLEITGPQNTKQSAGIWVLQ